MGALYDHQDLWNTGDVRIPKEHKEWAFDHILSPEVRAQMWAYYNSPEGIKNVKPIDGAIETIQRLINAGVFVFILSDRPADSVDDVVDWLYVNGLRQMVDFHHGYVDLIGGSGSSKADEVEQIMGMDAFEVVAIFEDAPHHHESYTDLHGDFGLYSFCYPYNEMQIIKGLATEVTSWAEFGDIVLNEIG